MGSGGAALADPAITSISTSGTNPIYIYARDNGGSTPGSKVYATSPSTQHYILWSDVNGGNSGAGFTLLVETTGISDGTPVKVKVTWDGATSAEDASLPGTNPASIVSTTGSSGVRTAAVTAMPSACGLYTVRVQVLDNSDQPLTGYVDLETAVTFDNPETNTASADYAGWLLTATNDGVTDKHEGMLRKLASWCRLRNLAEQNNWTLREKVTSSLMHSVYTEPRTYGWQYLSQPNYSFINLVSRSRQLLLENDSTVLDPTVRVALCTEWAPAAVSVARAAGVRGLTLHDYTPSTNNLQLLLASYQNPSLIASDSQPQVHTTGFGGRTGNVWMVNNSPHTAGPPSGAISDAITADLPPGEHTMFGNHMFARLDVDLAGTVDDRNHYYDPSFGGEWIRQPYLSNLGAGGNAGRPPYFVAIENREYSQRNATNTPATVYFFGGVAKVTRFLTDENRLPFSAWDMEWQIPGADTSGEVTAGITPPWRLSDTVDTDDYPEFYGGVTGDQAAQLDITVTNQSSVNAKTVRVFAVIVADGKLASVGHSMPSASGAAPFPARSFPLSASASFTPTFYFPVRDLDGAVARATPSRQVLTLYYAVIDTSHSDYQLDSAARPWASGTVNLGCWGWNCPGDVGSAGGLPGSDCQMTNDDETVFVDLYFGQDARADIGSTGGQIGPDQQFNNDDWVVFYDSFFSCK